MATSTESRSSTGLLIIVWLVVVIPAGWGIVQTANKSLDLFRGAPIPAATAPATLPN